MARGSHTIFLFVPVLSFFALSPLTLFFVAHPSFDTHRKLHLPPLSRPITRLNSRPLMCCTQLVMDIPTTSLVPFNLSLSLSRKLYSHYTSSRSSLP